MQPDNRTDMQRAAGIAFWHLERGASIDEAAARVIRAFPGMARESPGLIAEAVERGEMALEAARAYREAREDDLRDILALQQAQNVGDRTIHVRVGFGQGEPSTGAETGAEIWRSLRVTVPANATQAQIEEMIADESAEEQFEDTVPGVAGDTQRRYVVVAIF